MSQPEHTLIVFKKLKEHYINKQYPEIGSLEGDSYTDLYNDFLVSFERFEFKNNSSKDKQILKHFLETCKNKKILNVFYKFCEEKDIENGFRSFD